MGIYYDVHTKLGTMGAHPLDGVANSLETPPPLTHTCYSAEFSHSTSNSVSKSRDGLKKIGRSGAPPLKWRQADSLETYPSPTWATKQNLTTDGQMV